MSQPVTKEDVFEAFRQGVVTTLIVARDIPGLAQAIALAPMLPADVYERLAEEASRDITEALDSDPLKRVELLAQVQRKTRGGEEA